MFQPGTKIELTLSDLSGNGGNSIERIRVFKRLITQYSGKLFLTAIGVTFLILNSFGQNVASYSINLTASSDTSVTIPKTVAPGRSGDTCGGNNCIVFKVTLNTASDRVTFQASGGPALGSATYKTSCAGTAYNLGSPACLDGSGIVYITFCKVGNNGYDYTISTSSSVKGSNDISLRQGCSGSMSVTGLQAASIIWTSVYPGAAGTYDSYLFCKSGCASTTVTPQTGAPAYIDYKVSGPSTACSIARSDTIRVYTSPPLTVAITPNNPAICSGASTTLTATPTGGITPYSYSWSTGASISTISTATVGTYTVTVSDNASGCPAVAKSTVVSAAPTPAAPTAPGTSICAGSTATLTASAPGGTYQWYDASGNPLTSGASYTTPTLNTTTDYYVETTVSGCTSSRTKVTVTVNPIPAAPTATGATICAGNTASISASAPVGTYDWFSASSGGSSLFTGSTFVTPVLNANTTYYVQATNNSCTGTRTAVVVTVNPIPAAPTASAATVCSNTSASLQATAPGGSYKWYDQASGGTLLSSTAAYNTPLLTASTTYYVQTTVAGCTGNRTAVPVTITNSPVDPTASGASICVGSSTTLTATAPGGPYEWYDAPLGGNKVFTGASFPTNPIGSTTSYYVQSGIPGCMSGRTTVTVTVNPIPAAPSASASPICAGNTATLNAGTSGDIYQWYDAASGGNLLYTGATVTTGTLNTNTSYYVQSNINGCAGQRTTLTVTVNPIPAAPTVAASTTCSGTGATLSATAPGGAYEWYAAASGGPVLFSGATINTPALTANTWYYVQTTANGCTGSRTAVQVIVNPTPAAPTVAAINICAGTSTTLTATAPGGIYKWYDAPTGGNLLITSASYTTPVLSTSTDYYVETTVNGCTSTRTKATVTVTSLPSAPTAPATQICAGSTATLTAGSSGGTYQWYDAASAGNLLSTGSSYTTGALIADATYYVQSSINGCAGSRTAVTVTVNGIPAAPTAAAASTCVNSTATLQASGPGGTYDWFNTSSGGTSLATSASFVTPTLNANAVYYVASTISGCTGPRTAVNVTVNAIPAAPTVNGATICAGLSTTLAASAPGGTYNWYDAASGGNLLTIGTTYTTAPLNSTATFYVETNIAGCTGPRTAVTVTVNPIPAAPTATAGSTCEESTVTLTATAPGGIYQWYDAASNGTLLGGGASYTSGILTSNTIFYVAATVAGCTGSRTAVPVTVTPIPTSPSVASATICSGNNTNLTATAPGGTYNWYDAASGGNLIFTGATYTTPVLSSNATYYVQATVAGCTGSRSAVAVSVNLTPAAPTATGNTICAGTATTFTATAPGGIYQWYDAASGGNLLNTGAGYSTPVLNTSTNYYVQAVSTGCISPRTLVTATVVPIPAAPTVANASICEDNSATLTASAPGGQYVWYDAANGGSVLNTGASYITPLLSATTTYYVQTSITGCSSSRSPVTVTVIPKLNPSFQYSSGTFCISGVDPKPTILGNLSGIFSAAPAGIVFANTATGQINVAASTPGTYTIMFVTTGNCVYSSSARITITGTPDATFSYNGPFCQQQTNALPVFPQGASAGLFSASPAGLVFISNSTGEIDLQRSAPGTYSISNAIAASAGCSAANANVTATINPAATVSAGTNQTVCAGVTVQLSGTIGGAATKATWSGGQGVIANPASLNTTYTPAASESSVKLYLTTDDPAGPCGGAVDSMTIFITPTPANVTVAGTTICTATTATLVATAPGGVYEWYDAPAGGTLLATASSFTTPTLNSNTNYYVRSIVNNCAGSRTPVVVNVTTRPQVTSPATGAVCTGTQLKYLATSDQPGTIFNWSRNTAAGISNAANSGITDSTISEMLTNTSGAPVSVSYQITPANGNCIGNPIAVNVIVNPTPATPVVTSSTPVCVGSTLNLFTPSVANATYTWTGPNNFASNQQNPVLPGITLNSAGIYAVAVTVNGCTSQAGNRNIFPVIAAPAASSNAPVCAGNKLTLSAGNLTGAVYQWSGPGGFNATSQNPVINAASAINSGTYYLTASIAGCPGLTDSVKVLVNIPPATPQINSNSPICSRDSVVLNATGSNGTNYLWTGPNGFSSTIPNPVIRQASEQNSGTYTVIASTVGCTVTAVASLPVNVKTTPSAPTATSNSPVCEGSALNLFAMPVAGASYQWSTASGVFSSTTQNPVITNVTTNYAATYYVIASLNGCVGDTGFVTVAVVTPAVANAGGDKTVCANNATVQLNGTISGQDTKTGIWKSDGSGRFTPSESVLNASYLPSAGDTARGTVTLTLTTTNNKYCAVNSSTAIVNITDAPLAAAGPDKTVCSNDSLVTLQGSIANAGSGQWYSTGTGKFSRSGSSDLNAVYIPSAQDISKGAVQLYLLTNNNGDCLAVADTVATQIIKAPKVDAGPDRTIFLNDRFVFTPVVTGAAINYRWTPAIDLNDDRVKNAVLIAKNSTRFRLTVSGDSSCTAYDEIFITVLKPIAIPNIFSPNGDGIHDTWEIPELNAYPGATVEIFTRGGMKIYSSVGYAKPWDGTYNGNPVPVATYYYIVNPKYNGQLFSGSVTVIR